jgi:hypothetical protein
VETRSQNLIAVRAIAVGILVAVGFWIYIAASRRAAGGGFPLGDETMLIFLILLWWWGVDLFNRQAPFDSAGTGGSPMGTEARIEVIREDTVKKRLLWTTISFTCWLLLDLRAAGAARMAASDPSTSWMTRYEARSLEFLVFLFLWITVFPIVHSSAEDAASAVSHRRLANGIFIVAASIVALAVAYWAQPLFQHSSVLTTPSKFHLLQALLVRLAPLLYILLVIRRFTPLVFGGDLVAESAVAG